MKVCKDKMVYYSEQEAIVMCPDGMHFYLCPSCGNYHFTRQKSNQKNVQRFIERKRRFK